MININGLIRRYLLPESLENELLVILILLKLLLGSFLILFTIFGVLTVIHDLRRFTYESYDNLFADHFNSVFIFKSILVATAVFILPKLIWSSLSISPFVRNLVEGRREMITETPKSFFPIEDIIKPVKSQRYKRIIQRISEHFKNSGSVQSKKILEFYDKKFENDNIRTSENCIFIFGRKRSGKTAFVQAVCGSNSFTKSAKFASSAICVYEYKYQDLIFYEFTISPAFEKSDDSVIKATLEFISTNSIAPSLILNISNAKEVHSTFPKDLKFLQGLLHQLYLLYPCLVHNFENGIPLIQLCSFSDEIYPSDIRKDYDSEKMKNISLVLEALSQQYSSFKTEIDLSCDETTWVPIELYGIYIMSSLFHQTAIMENGIAKYEINPLRDYRFNISRISQDISQVCIKKKFDESQQGDSFLNYSASSILQQRNTFFALNLVQLFTNLISIGGPEQSLSSKYSVQFLMVSTIVMELTPSALESSIELDRPTVNIDDPRLSNMAVYSLKVLSQEYLRAMADEVLKPYGSSMIDFGTITTKFGMVELTERLGEATIAFFIEQRCKSTVKKVFEGNYRYTKFK